MTDTSELIAVHVGQVWEDNDPRIGGYSHRRTVTVLQVYSEYAIVSSNRGFRSRIRLDRFRPGSTGYRLVKDVSHGG